MPWLGNKSIIQKILYPSPVYQSNSQISKVLSMIPNEATIADFGAGGRKITDDTITIDFVKIGSTDIIADIHEIPLKNDSFDCIFCTGTLEHVECPEKVIEEIRRVTKNNGIIYIDVPFIQCYHPDPVDYWRFSIKGLELLCQRNGFEKIDSGTNIGSASAFSWVSISFVDSLLPAGILSKIVSKIVGYLLLPIKFLDRFTVNGPNQYLAPSAVYFVGKKK